jgi:ribosomal protein S18 acetylase RimI-like enzyme
MTAGAFRAGPRPSDRAAVRRLVAETGVFSETEIGWAVEVVEAALGQGEAAGYHFLFADGPSDLEGFTCFGPIEGTANRFDLYWIAVSPTAQGKGLGRDLLRQSMTAARRLGATHLFIDTSTRADYAAAHALYEAQGFTRMGTLADYYADGDGKALFGRKL